MIAASGTMLVLAWQLAELVQNGVIAQTRQDPESLAFGLAICVLLALVMPKMSFFAMIGAFSYTIYPGCAGRSTSWGSRTSGSISCCASRPG